METKYVAPKNRKALLEYANGNFFLDEQISYVCLEKAVCLPYQSGKGEGGVVDIHGKFQMNTTLNASFGDGSYSFEENEVKNENKDAIFIGTLYSVFGHVITDDLKKLWFLHSELGKKLLEEGADVVFITWHNQKLKPYVQHILSLAGVNLEAAKCIDVPTKYKHIYVPEDSLLYWGGKLCYTNEYKKTIEKIEQKIPWDNKPIVDKIYLSRTALHDWRDYGEKKVEKAFKEQRYMVVHPEQLTFEQQVSLYRRTKEIASTEGSLSHMFLFCRPQTKVVILKKANYINEYQMMINAFSKVDAIYIDANHSIECKNPWDGPFYLSLTRYLKHYLNVRKLDFFFLRLDFYIYILRFIKSRLL